MPSSWKIHFFALCTVALASLYLLLPSFYDFLAPGTASRPPPFLSSKKLNLGLDLRGGMYIEMDVDKNEALKNRMDTLTLQIERQLEEQKIAPVKITPDYSQAFFKVDVPSDKRTVFFQQVRDIFGEVFDASTMGADPGSGDIRLKVRDEYLEHTYDQTVKQAVEAVRNRVDRYGVAEASIQRQGADRIIIEVPGVKDPERVIDIIRRTGKLEFRLVDNTTNRADLHTLTVSARTEKSLPNTYDKDTVAKINEALQEKNSGDNGKIPEDTEVLFEVERDPVTKEIVGGIPYLVRKRAEVTGDMLRSAQVGIQDNQPHVSLSFNQLGTQNFGEVTKNNIGSQLAIVLDGVIASAPVIQSAILTGEAQITLGFGAYQTLLKEAEDLALTLREGALPASLTIATKNIIGPSLGLDSIEKGLKALVIAGAIIILFMMAYYKLGGILASVALILNVLLIFAVLTLFQASLSLPGMAGIVLTMGMAVDANIIIFERMREERRLGKTAKSVVDSGYHHAMSAILDSNITTLIAGIVLYQFGSGPIKGFATTLVIGIATTMYTAIVFTRLIYDYFLIRRRITQVIF